MHVYASKENRGAGGVGRGVGDAGGEGIKEFKDFLNSLIINR